MKNSGLHKTYPNKYSRILSVAYEQDQKRKKMALHSDNKNMLQTWFWVWEENQEITRGIWDQPKMVVLQPNLKIPSSLHKITGRLMLEPRFSDTVLYCFPPAYDWNQGASVAFSLQINSHTIKRSTNHSCSSKRN